MLLDRQQAIGAVLLMAGTLAIAMSNRSPTSEVGDRNIAQVAVLVSSSGDVELAADNGRADKVGDLFLWHCVNNLPAPFGVLLMRDRIDWSYGSVRQGSGPPIKPALSQTFERSRGLLADGLSKMGEPDIAARLRDGRLVMYRPCWPPVLLSLGLVTLGAGCLCTMVPSRAQRARRRVAHGECPGCGYSMADLEDVPVCPECGRARSL